MRTSTISFTVPGLPRAQKRHRTYMKGKGGKPLPFARNVDPSKQDKANFLAQCRRHAPDAPWTGPLRLTVVFLFPHPKTHYRTGKHSNELRPDAPSWHTSRPDTDNLCKLVKDALSGVFYRDDAQIAGLVATKCYAGETPQTCVTLTAL